MKSNTNGLEKRLRVAPTAAAVLPPRSAPQTQSPRHAQQAVAPPLKTQVYCLFKWGGIRQYAQRNLSQVEEGERTTQISFVLVDFMALACTCLARHPDRIEEADAPELTDKPSPAVTHRGQEKIRSATEIKAT